MVEPFLRNVIPAYELNDEQGENFSFLIKQNHMESCAEGALLEDLRGLAGKCALRYVGLMRPPFLTGHLYLSDILQGL